MRSNARPARPAPPSTPEQAAVSALLALSGAGPIARVLLRAQEQHPGLVHDVAQILGEHFRSLSGDLAEDLAAQLRRCQEEVRQARAALEAVPFHKAGEFGSFSDWVNYAQLQIGGTGAVCVDAQGRRCRIGADFQRADREGSFPVSYWLPKDRGS